MGSTTIKKIWKWTKEMACKIADLIPDWFKRNASENSDPAPGVLTELDKKLGQKIQKREVRRPVDTRRGGPNMPKYQFCNCGRPAKRTKKTLSGAHYKCPIHGEFLVRALGL